ncbi:YolD-like family protein [Staphylococcus sp. 18_1_E_LY]|uniref:YolD-like family protein n=1 Tax=Staphylococcus lloydii TaxID=2781774 RepID=A0A7T1FA72_9STAP|nr:YolD-like family protein [Staphylococcus lloydii]MBF7020586.1 YolD-like family protein [Staphylococcus lloydii]MBF7028269.1 YolD-like family protein [Staphylococcus lloydii]QPM76005.1 YolD-like family protein [Staphylococcus lloydii]
MIPDKYKKETDYRKIPREYLSKDIPMGRGMVKWAPFATLPEQFETIQNYIIDQNKIDRPILSDDQLNDLNIHLHQSLHNNRPVQLEYYQEGWLKSLSLTIKHIDMINMYLTGITHNDGEEIKISLFDVTKIQQL